MAQEDSVRGFRVAIAFNDSVEMLEMVKDAHTHIGAKNLSARVDFSHPLDFVADPNSGMCV